MSDGRVEALGRLGRRSNNCGDCGRDVGAILNTARIMFGPTVGDYCSGVVLSDMSKSANAEWRPLRCPECVTGLKLGPQMIPKRTRKVKA